MPICRGWARYLFGWQEVQLPGYYEHEEQKATVVSQARQLRDAVEYVWGGHELLQPPL